MKPVYGIICNVQNAHIDLTKSEIGAKRIATKLGIDQITVRYNGGYVASVFAKKVNGKWKTVNNSQEIKAKVLATCWDIPDYYDFRKGILNGKKGYFYTLCQKLKQEDKERLTEKYNNIDFLVNQLQYAPEITHNVIFLSNTAN